MRTHALLVAVLVLAVGAAAPPASAHDNYRIIGIITRVTSTTLDVKQTRDGRQFSMRMDRATLVKRDKEKLAVSELKPGLNVVVDASGDTIDDLLVSDVRIVPAPGKD